MGHYFTPGSKCQCSRARCRPGRVSGAILLLFKRVHFKKHFKRVCVCVMLSSPQQYRTLIKMKS